jgi:PIN domain nuclease of toxin-antitoxin system
MAPFVGELPTLLERQGGLTAGLDPAICAAAGTLSWERSDPFDRLIRARRTGAWAGPVGGPAS